jgi:opacity protein-like surface antigen
MTSMKGAMRFSRFAFFLAVGGLAGINAARAADLPAPMPVKAPVIALPGYDWSGFYVGAHMGYIWGRSRVFDNGVLTESGAPTEGAVGGLLAGYNWQTGPLVLGLEGDFGWSNATGHGTTIPALPPPPALPSAPNTYRLRWDSHIAAKAGYAAGQWLFFATGGLAVAGFSFQEGVVPGTPQPNAIDATYVGYSVGAGVEYAFTQNLLGRLQYIYDDFGGKSFAGTDGGSYRVNLTAQTARAALSWKF